MLKMAKIGKVYRTGLIETAAIEDVSLDVGRGDFVSLMGPSGSGKTTFLNIAGLLDTFDRGRYLLDGVDVAGLSDDQQSRLRNVRIGFIFQSFNLIPDLNVFDNVDVPLRYRRMPANERRERINAALDIVGLGSRTKHLPSQLSGGQQQRVAVARAVAGSPSILLADEPTGNLDSKNGEAVMELLRELHREGATICMVTHDPRYARHADRSIHLFDGRVVEEDGSKKGERELEESGFDIAH